MNILDFIKMCEKFKIHLDKNKYLSNKFGYIFISETHSQRCKNTLYCSGKDIDSEKCKFSYNNIREDNPCKSIKQYFIDNPEEEFFVKTKIEEYIIGEL
ncbi:MAG: hypothetical protein H7836_04650 [Magnetococcus sp. YQC-3]